MVINLNEYEKEKTGRRYFGRHMRKNFQNSYG